MNETVGYCMPKKYATGHSPIDLSNFQEKPCRALEINHKTKSVLILDPGAKALGMFDFDQLDSFFECEYFNGIIIPSGLDFLQKFMYYTRVFSHPQNAKRDMKIITQLVIVQSLMKKAFCDTLYFNFAH